MRNLRIVFMGTPDFAVGSLEALLAAEYNIVGVITAPDRPAGRGRKIQQSAVKKYALEKGLTVLQPTNLKNEDFVIQLKALNANLQIVVAFRMLPTIVWKMPKLGTINLHASLLPDYRGAAPINWAIINGESKTGVTTFFIDDKIDTGNIILQEEVLIAKDEIVGTLHNKLMSVGGKLVVKTVRLIEQSNITTTVQPKNDFKVAPKIYPETCRINWEDSLDNIYNLIRGLNPYPAARTFLYNDTTEIQAKLYDIDKEFQIHPYKTGQIIIDKNELKVAVKNGFIIINSLQLSGKRRMESANLLNGFKFHKSATFR